MKIKNIIQKISSYRKYIIGVAIVLCLSVGAYMTISYLTSDSSLENTFTIASVQPEVKETFENDIKSNVYVKNNGDIPVYIRAKIMIYYQDQDKKILGDIPNEDDYTITYPENLKDCWIPAEDGFYYYIDKVDSQSKTTQLIKKCESKVTDPDKHLVVDIITEAIQANPQEAVEDAWEAVTVNGDGKLEKAEVDEP